MRLPITTGFVLASLGVALAQSPLPADPISSLSSKLGPFYTSILFAPGLQNYDYVTAVGSGGPSDPNTETTTWKAYKSADIEKADTGVTPWAYQNFTVGPTTYMATNTYTEYTIDSSSGYHRTRHASSMTSNCTFTSTPAKSPIHDFLWATAENKDISRANKNNWPTLSALCTHTGYMTNDGREFALSGTTWDADRVWKMVTVLGVEPMKMTATTTTTAEGGKETGSENEAVKETSTSTAAAREVTAWVNAVVVVAAAAVMAA